jgi:hypothetical protein
VRPDALGTHARHLNGLRCFADRRWFVDAARSVVARPARESPGMALNAIPFCAVQPHAQIPYHDLEAIRQSA